MPGCLAPDLMAFCSNQIGRHRKMYYTRTVDGKRYFHEKADFF